MDECRMTMYHGLGMFILGMFAIIVGGMIAWYVINKVMEDDEKK
jgi:energy-converting hydrogenase Eha subunit E